VSLSSTFRRIGEEIYKSYNKSDIMTENTNSKQLVAYNSVEELNSQSLSNEAKDLDGQFLQSEIPQIRIISCFIILRTLNQGRNFNF
jgi:hypothetical protein